MKVIFFKCIHHILASFEVTVNKQQVYSKLRTMAFPDFDEVVEVVDEVKSGSTPREVTKYQEGGWCTIL